MRRSVALQPRLLEAQLKLSGVLLCAVQELVDAENVYREIVRRDPVHRPEAWNNLGFVLLQQHRLDEAKSVLVRAKPLDPDLATARTNLGSLKLMQGDLDGAKQDLLQAIELDRTSVAAYGNLGIIYLRRDRLDDASAMFEMLLSIDPTDANARAMLDEVAVRRGTGS